MASPHADVLGSRLCARVSSPHATWHIRLPAIGPNSGTTLCSRHCLIQYAPLHEKVLFLK